MTDKNNPSARISELESEVQRLNREMEALARQASAAPSPSSQQGHLNWDRARAHLVADVRRGVDYALGGEAGETIESRIGGSWLGMAAALLVMTGLVLFLSENVAEDILSKGQKLGIVFGVATVGLILGSFRGAQSTLAKAVLGCALAGIYYATYAAFFVESVRMFPNTRYAIATLLTCLAFMAVVIALRRSQTVAGIALFLVYYTVLASGAHEMHQEALVYALATGLLIAVMTLIYMTLFRWVLFSWFSLIAIYGTHVYFFWTKPASLAVPNNVYFYATTGFLAACFMVLAMASIVEARTKGDFKRMVAPLAVANSILFLALAWRNVAEYHPDYQLAFRLGFAIVLTFLALCAETAGPHRNYLFQVFLAKAVIMYTLSLYSYLTGELMLVGMAAVCLFLAVTYHLSGVVALKVINIVLLAMTLFWSLFAYQYSGTVTLGQLAMPSDWFTCVGVCLLFAAAAWYYEAVASERKPGDRTKSGQWFLADSALDLPTASVSMFHAAAAALVLLVTIILAQGDNPALPFHLTLASVTFASVGFLTRTPQLEAASVTLLVAGHIAFHFFVHEEQPDFQSRDTFAVYTALMALYTYVGGFMWEGYLARERRGPVWEHHIVACIPYLMATYMLITFIDRHTGTVNSPLAINGLGVSMILVSFLIRYSGVKAAAVFAMAFGMGLCAYRLRQPESGLTDDPYYVGYVGGMLLSCIVAERLIVAATVKNASSAWVTGVARFVLVAAAAALGVLAVDIWAGPEARIMLWMSMGLVTFLMGIAFRAGQYRWVALGIFAVTVGGAFFLPGPWEARTFGALGAAALIVSAFYSQSKLRGLRGTTPSRPRGSADG
jgi:hypothetical protein